MLRRLGLLALCCLLAGSPAGAADLAVAGTGTGTGMTPSGPCTYLVEIAGRRSTNAVDGPDAWVFTVAAAKLAGTCDPALYPAAVSGEFACQWRADVGMLGGCGMGFFSLGPAPGTVTPAVAFWLAAGPTALIIGNAAVARS